MKPGTFTQLNVQLVFAVKYRECLLNESIRKEVFSYISGIVTNMGHKSLIVNGFADHVHVFLALNPAISISDTVASIKKSSAAFINEKRWLHGKFQWQYGYGGFSYSRNSVKTVYNYIANQEEHHKKHPFRKEFMDSLTEEGIDFDKRFLFDFFDDLSDI